MRSAYVAGAAVAAVQASSVVIVGQVTTDAVALPVWEGNSTTAWAAQPSVTELSTINTTVLITSTLLPNATTSEPAQATGGAIPQQMQSSIVGLLGFCIMSLIMF